MSSLWGDALPPEQPIEKTKPLRHMTNAQILVHRSKDNPCVRVFGAGPNGKQCKTCIHLYTQGNVQGTYYKCKKRGTPTGGPGTDHRVRWPACAKYEEAQP